MKYAFILIVFIVVGCSLNQMDREQIIHEQSVPSQNPVATRTPTPSALLIESPRPTIPTPTITPVAAQQQHDLSDHDSTLTGNKPYQMNKNYDIIPKDTSGNRNVVLLTFDDGPKNLAMNQALIDILIKHNAKAIFFLNGYRIKQHPELVTLLFENGQVIGNHSYDHIDLKKQTPEVIEFQINEVQNLVKSITGVAPTFFRPPFGSSNELVREQVRKSNMLYMNWSNGSLDWEMNVKNNNPSQVVEEVLKQLHKGSNILMHELPWTVQALDRLLTELVVQGYSFVDPHDIDIEIDPYSTSSAVSETPSR